MPKSPGAGRDKEPPIGMRLTPVVVSVALILCAPPVAQRPGLTRITPLDNILSGVYLNDAVSGAAMCVLTQQYRNRSENIEGDRAKQAYDHCKYGCPTLLPASSALASAVNAEP